MHPCALSQHCFYFQEWLRLHKSYKGNNSESKFTWFLRFFVCLNWCFHFKGREMEIHESNTRYLISTSSRFLHLYLHFTAVFWIKSKTEDSGWLQFPNSCFMTEDSTFLYKLHLYNTTSNSWNLKCLYVSILADRQEVMGIKELLQSQSRELLNPVKGMHSNNS